MLQDRKKKSNELWRDLMIRQVDLLFPAELSFYMNEIRWLESRSVLDIGTGNAYYLSNLANYFPEKSYTGIDIDLENIKFAQQYLDNSKNRVGNNIKVIAQKCPVRLWRAWIAPAYAR